MIFSHVVLDYVTVDGTVDRTRKRPPHPTAREHGRLQPHTVFIYRLVDGLTRSLLQGPDSSTSSSAPSTPPPPPSPLTSHLPTAQLLEFIQPRHRVLERTSRLMSILSDPTASSGQPVARADPDLQNDAQDALIRAVRETAAHSMRTNAMPCEAHDGRLAHGGLEMLYGELSALALSITQNGASSHTDRDVDIVCCIMIRKVLISGSTYASRATNVLAGQLTVARESVRFWSGRKRHLGNTLLPVCC